MRMMGFPVNNLCFENRGNQSMLPNVSIPDSILKKKTASVSYHFVRNGVSAMSDIHYNNNISTPRLTYLIFL